MSEYHKVVYAIKRILDTAKVPYQEFQHEAVRTSEEAALVRPEYTLTQGAKALIVRIKRKDETGKEIREFFQVVVPGDKKFDAKKVKAVLKAKDMRFATEEEVKELTGGVEPGGVPPFGNLFGIRVIADKEVFAHEELIFNAGDRRFSIAMKSEDYLAIVKPSVAPLV